MSGLEWWWKLRPASRIALLAVIALVLFSSFFAMNLEGLGMFILGLTLLFLIYLAILRFSMRAVVVISTLLLILGGTIDWWFPLDIEPQQWEGYGYIYALCIIPFSLLLIVFKFVQNSTNKNKKR